MTSLSARRALLATICAALTITGLTSCTNEIADAQETARAHLRDTWTRTGENLRSVDLRHGTPSRQKLLQEGVPAFAPAANSDATVYGSSALALTTKLVRGKQAFTVDLFLLSDGTAGSGDLSKQRSAYACVRVTVARGVYRLVPHQLPCRRDLLHVREEQSFQRVVLHELRVAE